MPDYDFFIYYVDDVCLHFSFEGDMLIWGEGEAISVKDMQKAIDYYKALKDKFS